jgi:hypothetical protein
MGLMRDEAGIDLNCASCGELRLDAKPMYCPVCGEPETVCFECIPKDDERRIDREDSRHCTYCQEAMDDD